MRLAGHSQQIDQTPADYGISADDRILIDYWRKQLIATMLSGDEDGSVQANVMLHKLLAKYQKNPKPALSVGTDGSSSK